EANRERVQVCQGVVIRRSGGGIRETFTVRKISFGVGVERTFPVHSPTIARLELLQRGKVRRAKLYYLRDLRGKKARIKERREDDVEIVELDSDDDDEAESEAQDETQVSETETDDAAGDVSEEETQADEDAADESLAEELTSEEDPAAEGQG